MRSDDLTVVSSMLAPTSCFGQPKSVPCIVAIPDDSLMPAGFPNDAFFKEMLSHPPRAIAFFQSHLPPAMAAAADWTSQKLLFVPKTKTNSHEAAKARRNETRYSLFFRGLVTS
jgi:hypothetical protein